MAALFITSFIYNVLIDRGLKYKLAGLIALFSICFMGIAEEGSQLMFPQLGHADWLDLLAYALGGVSGIISLIFIGYHKKPIILNMKNAQQVDAPEP